MKCLIRSCCVLLCCLSLFIISSVPVSASEIDVPPYHIYIQSWALDGEWVSVGAVNVNCNDGVLQSKAFEHFGTSNFHNVFSRYQFVADDNSSFITSGQTSSFLIENFTEQVNVNGYLRYIPTKVTVSVYYTDGTFTTVECEIIDKTDRYDIRFTVSAEKDINKIEVDTEYYLLLDSPYWVQWELGEIRKDTDFAFRIDIQDPNTGLLSGILDSLTSGLSNLFQGIVNVGNYILDLPSKLLSAFGDWIKSVFQPSDEFMEDYRERAIALCEENFGALWEVVMIGFESWESINASDLTDSIDVPEVSIPLPDNNEFTFGGYNVRVVPEGFEFLATALKTIVGIVCSLAFVKGLRKRYDEIMEVDS